MTATEESWSRSDLDETDCLAYPLCVFKFILYLKYIYIYTHTHLCFLTYNYTYASS